MDCIYIWKGEEERERGRQKERAAEREREQEKGRWGGRETEQAGTTQCV